MTYKLIKNPTFVTEAKFHVPTDDGPIEQSIRVRFRVLQDAEGMQVDDFLRAAVLDLRDIVEEDGTPVAFGPDLLERVIATPVVRVGLMKAYWAALAGARLGN